MTEADFSLDAMKDVVRALLDVLTLKTGLSPSEAGSFLLDQTDTRLATDPTAWKDFDVDGYHFSIRSDGTGGLEISRDY